MFAARMKNETRKIQRERSALLSEGIDLLPCTREDLGRWTLVLSFEDKTTLFAGQQYRIAVELPQDYPMSPPRCRFVSHIFHPNVEKSSGDICLNILHKDEWSPAFTLISLAHSLMALCNAPNCDSPLNCDAASLFRLHDLRAYRSIVLYTHSS